MDSVEEIKSIWSEIKKLIASEYSETTFNLWFENLDISSMNDTEATLVINSDFKRDILEKKYLSVISSKFEEIIGFPIKVKIISSETSVEIENIKIDNTENLFLQDDKSNEPKLTNNEYTFDNFVVGESNKYAHAASIAVANSLSKTGVASSYNPLFIHGPSGLGKTHLMYAVINQIKKTNPNAKIVYKKSEDFTTELIDSISNQNMSAFREKYRKADILLIDDIQFIAGKESTQEEFFHTFNALYEDNKQIFLTSDRPPRDIKKLEDRLYTRFEWGLIVDIQPPDIELRMAILKKKLAALNIDMSSDVIIYLAEHLKNNIRQLEGALKKLSAMCFLSGKPIEIDTAKALIQDMIKGDQPATVTVDKIFNVVSKKYGIPVEQIKGKKQTKENANARHICIYLIRTLTDYSLPQIGQVLNRDSSTVLTSYRKIEKLISEDAMFEMDMNDLIRDIKER